MIAVWRPLPRWPHPPRTKRSDQFKSSWVQTLHELEAEISALGGSDLLIGVVADPSQFTIAGTLRGNAKILHPGAEVSFDAKGQRLTFFTDAYPFLGSNLRAIALGLKALRAVDRYGITSTAEQYAGFAALPAGGPDASRGKLLVERAGGVTEALKRHHPDHGGSASDFADVQAYREAKP